MNDDSAKKSLGDEDVGYPKYGPNTTKDDLREASYVLGRPATMCFDMESYCSEEDYNDEMSDKINRSNLAPNWYAEASLTLMPSKSKMEEDIVASVIKDMKEDDDS